MNWVAVDIGGANLKAADGAGFAISQPFPLWRRPSGLSCALEQLLHVAPPFDSLAITMTGELADCFATKAEGVRFILSAVQQAAPGVNACVYLTNGQFVTVDEAVHQPRLAAASNWHALAEFSGRYAADALLLDIGSTTTDLISIQDGLPSARGRTDTERLQTSELVYCGAKRTPICALTQELPYRGAQCPVASELFSTTWDVYLLLGDLPEEPVAVNTADGRPATRDHARDRIARMLCTDRDSFTEADAIAAAQHVAESQTKLLKRAVRSVWSCCLQPPNAWIISGEGEFLARRVIKSFSEALVAADFPVLSIAEQIGNTVSACAAAHALAVLANERIASR